MNPEIFTDKTTSTINKAHELSREFNHVQLHPSHLVCALFDDEDGLVRSIVTKAGGDPAIAERRLKSLMVKQPSQDPGPDQLSMHPGTLKALRAADDIRKKQKDSHLSVDHLILGLLEVPEVIKAFEESGM